MTDKKVSESVWDNRHYKPFLHSFTPTKWKNLIILEKVNKKLINFSLSVRFNKICLKEELLLIYELY